MNNLKYIILGPLKIQDLSVTQPDIISGYIMPTAIAGFGYKTVLDIQSFAEDTDITHEGCSIVIHDHSILEGLAKLPPEGKDGSKGGPIIENSLARAEVTIIIAVGNMDVSEKVVSEFLANAIPNWLLAGGKVFPTSLNLKNLVRIANNETLVEALKSVKPGYVLIDRKDLLDQEIADGCGNVDSLDAIINCIEFAKVDEPANAKKVETNSEAGADETQEKVTVYKRKHPGWLVPILVGFQAIERPQTRSPMRSHENISKHVFAESLYSLGEYKFLHSLVSSFVNDALEGSFWSHKHNAASETYYVSTLSN